MLEPTAIYDGDVTVKMTKNHVYYVQYKDDPLQKWQRSQGVTGALEELYSQRALIGWAADQAASNVVKSLAGPANESWLDRAFLSIWKGETPEAKSVAINPHLNGQDLINLYEQGHAAHTRKADYGKSVGTQVHDAIDNYHRTGQQLVETSGDESQDTVAKDSFDAYIQWFKQSGLRILETERVVHSQRYNYCGTLDRIYIDKNGGLLIGDFKTSNLSKSTPTGIRAQYWSQIGAYALAYAEETGVEFVDTIIVNSPKNGKIKVVRGSSLKPRLDVQQCIQMWKYDLQAFRMHKQVNLSMVGVESEV